MTIRILHYTDIEDIYDDPDRLGVLSNLITRKRDENTIVVGSGDNVAPSALAMRMKGKQSLSFFSTIEPDADTFGNHDFDYGSERLLEIVRESPQKWVCANVYAGSDRFGVEEGVVPYQVVETADYSVGLFGIAHPDTGTIAPVAADLAFTDPVEAASTAAERLRERDVDCVVGLCHRAENHDIARAVDVDVLLAGHRHERPCVERVDDVLLARPSGAGKDLQEVTVDSERAVTRHSLEDGVADRQLARRFRDLKCEYGLSEQLATFEDRIDRTMRERYLGESRIGNLVADAFRWATGADVGLQNSGGIGRGDPLHGTVTREDVMSVLPYNKSVVVVAIPGETLLEVFHEGDNEEFSASSESWHSYSWHAHLSGATVEYDYSTATVVDAKVNGESVVPGETYTVTTSEYLVETDHEFPPLEADHRIETTGKQHAVLAEYLETVEAVPDIEGRVVRHGVDTALVESDIAGAERTEER